MAHERVVSGRKKFLIPVMKEDITLDDLDPDLQKYIKTHTYIKAESDLSHTKKRLVFAMPRIPLIECSEYQEIGNGRLLL